MAQTAAAGWEGGNLRPYFFFGLSRAPSKGNGFFSFYVLARLWVKESISGHSRECNTSSGRKGWKELVRKQSIGKDGSVGKN